MQWQAPFTDGGSPITGSKITAYVNGAPVRTMTFDSPATSGTVTGLKNGTTYTFRASAINVHGVGLPSNMTAPIKVGVPSAPTGLTATPGDGRVILRWQLSSPHGAPLTGYTITLTRRSASVAPRIWRTKFPGITVALPNGTTGDVPRRRDERARVGARRAFPACSPWVRRSRRPTCRRCASRSARCA